MSQLGQGQVGSLKSTPKLTRVNGDDHKKVIYRNLGNNHAYPFIWATTATITSGTQEVVVASGIKWHGYDLATYASVAATPEGNVGYLYVEKNTDTNIIKIKSSVTASADTDVALIFMLGGDLDVEGLVCRGTGAPAPSLP